MKSEKINKGAINMKIKKNKKENPVSLLYILPILDPLFTFEYSFTLASKILVSRSFCLNH
jgi:hypothetical protein